jgi:CheY-like chemotaxis protein
VSSILIVDDHASFRLQARALLEAQGHSVVGEAADGRQALELAAKLRPELVLLDIGLPDMDGFEVARLLAQGGAPPVVVLTSSRDASAYGPLIEAAPVAAFIAKDDLGSGAFVALALGKRQ